MAHTTRWAAALSRRSFLRYSALTSGLLTLSHLRLTPALAAAAAPAPRLQVFTPREAEILTVITERMVFSGQSSMPAVRETRAIPTIDQAVLQLDPSVQSELRWLLAIFQWAPPLLQLELTTFTGMSPEDQDAYIRGWANSRSDTRKLAFRALKNLAMLGYYSQDATWKGIHYDGPWAPRGRRIVSNDR